MRDNCSSGKLVVPAGVSEKVLQSGYYGTLTERTAWQYLTRKTFTLFDGKKFLSLALCSFHETVNQILEFTREVRSAGGRQYQLVMTFFEVDVNGDDIIMYTKTSFMRRGKQMKMYAQVEKLLRMSLKPTVLDIFLACKYDHRIHEGLHLVCPGNSNYLI